MKLPSELRARGPSGGSQTACVSCHQCNLTRTWAFPPTKCFEAYLDCQAAVFSQFKMDRHNHDKRQGPRKTCKVLVYHSRRNSLVLLQVFYKLKGMWAYHCQRWREYLAQLSALLEQKILQANVTIAAILDATWAVTMCCGRAFL